MDGLTTDTDPTRKTDLHIRRLFSSCPTLSAFSLSTAGDYQYTNHLFRSITEAMHASQISLEELSLKRVLAGSAQFASFLQAHPKLRRLNLDSVNITGDIAFRDILGLIHITHQDLEDFRCWSMTQNGVALRFESLNDVAMDAGEDWNPDLLEDFVVVTKLYGHGATAEAWEGVLYKIGLLKEDLRIGGRMYLD